MATSKSVATKNILKTFLLTLTKKFKSIFFKTFGIDSDSNIFYIYTTVKNASTSFLRYKFTGIDSDELTLDSIVYVYPNHEWASIVNLGETSVLPELYCYISYNNDMVALQIKLPNAGKDFACEAIAYTEKTPYNVITNVSTTLDENFDENSPIELTTDVTVNDFAIKDKNELLVPYIQGQTFDSIYEAKLALSAQTADTLTGGLKFNWIYSDNGNIYDYFENTAIFKPEDHAIIYDLGESLAGEYDGLNISPIGTVTKKTETAWVYSSTNLPLAGYDTKGAIKISSASDTSTNRFVLITNDGYAYVTIPTIPTPAEILGACVPQVTTLPELNYEAIYLYIGETDASYTKGYFYKNTILQYVAISDHTNVVLNDENGFIGWVTDLPGDFNSTTTFTFLIDSGRLNCEYNNIYSYVELVAGAKPISDYVITGDGGDVYVLGIYVGSRDLQLEIVPWDSFTPVLVGEPVTILYPVPVYGWERIDVLPGLGSLVVRSEEFLNQIYDPYRNSIEMKYDFGTDESSIEISNLGINSLAYSKIKLLADEQGNASIVLSIKDTSLNVNSPDNASVDFTKTSLAKLNSLIGDDNWEYGGEVDLNPVTYSATENSKDLVYIDVNSQSAVQIDLTSSPSKYKFIKVIISNNNTVSSVSPSLSDDPSDPNYSLLNTLSSIPALCVGVYELTYVPKESGQGLGRWLVELKISQLRVI